LSGVRSQVMSDTVGSPAGSCRCPTAQSGSPCSSAVGEAHLSTHKAPARRGRPRRQLALHL